MKYFNFFLLMGTTPFFIIAIEQFFLNYLGEKKKNILKLNFESYLCYTLNNNMEKSISEKTKIFYFYNWGWYEKKAFTYKYSFLFYSILSLSLSLSIPLLSLIEVEIIDTGINSRILTTYLSGLLTLISSYIFLINPRDKWSQYRKIAEQLKVIPFKLNTSTINFEEVFIKSIIEIIEKDHEEWYIKSSKKNIHNFMNKEKQ